jgi:hypothetical protein
MEETLTWMNGQKEVNRTTGLSIQKLPFTKKGFV